MSCLAELLHSQVRASTCASKAIGLVCEIRMAGSGSNRWEQVRTRATGIPKVNTGIKRSIARWQPRRRIGTGDSRQSSQVQSSVQRPATQHSNRPLPLSRTCHTHAGICRKAWVSYVGGPPTSQFVKMAEAGQHLFCCRIDLGQ